MIFGVFFAFWRFLEIITLIPTLSMLAYFVHIYASHNALTPTYILLLFIVSVLGAAWALFTLFSYHRSKSNAFFVSFIDLCFVGAFIASVYELRFISSENCSSVGPGAGWGFIWGWGGNWGTGLSVDIDKTCALLKASFAFGIMNCIFFFITSLMACFHGRGREEKVVVTRQESHYSRHGHRRSGSHRSHRSSHSGRRSAYV